MTVPPDQTKPIRLLAPDSVPGSTALYRFYDDRSQLLYIGISDDPRARWYQHSRTQPWWGEVAHATAQWLSHDQAALSEKQAIGNERPRYNRAHAEDRRAARRAVLRLPEPIPIRVASSEADLVSFTQAARRLVEIGLVISMTRQGLRFIAETDPDWPVPDRDLVKIGNAKAMPWAAVEQFFRQRNALGAAPGRGPDQGPRRRRTDLDSQ